MANPPKIDLHISTASTDSNTGTYSITFEAINPEGITPHIFVVTRLDKQSSTPSFSRVASLYDIKDLEASSITEYDSYRVSSFTIETTSLSLLKQYKDNVPKVVQSLLDTTARGLELDILLGIDSTITLVGEYE